MTYRHNRFAIISAAALLSGFGFLSCDHSPPPRPANDVVIRAFGTCSANEPPPGTLPNVELRLDDSLSMAGYVSMPSAYRSVLRRVVEGAVQAGYPSAIRGFSSSAAVPLDSLGAVLQPAYYAARDTRLAAVLDDISAPRENGEPEKIVVLFSDLIQDEQSRDSLAIATSLRKVAARYPNIILYGFRSAFRGTYYITSPPRGKVKVDTIDGVGRPFYVLVLAPSPHALRRFQQFAGLFELLNEKTYGGQTFEPSFAPVVIDYAKLRTDPDPEKNEWVGFEAPTEWNCGDGRRVQIHSLQAPSAHDGAATLSFTVRATSLLPIVVPSRYQADVRRLSRSGATAEQAPDVTMTATGDVGNPSSTLNYRFPSPPPRQWQVYSIRLRPGDANLMHPKWITDWSTDDDTRDDSRDRTLNLTAFGDALVRAVAERDVFLEQIIELYRGE
jgi:hypothetical protein